MSTRTRQRIGYSTLVVLVVALIVAVIASNVWLRGARLDLTANGLYTLGKGTHAVLKDIKEPIDLYFFFSNESTKNLQQLRAYANRVRETLEEFAANTPDGRLVLHVVDPVQFSEDEDRAEQFGLQAANIGAGGESVYFGLAGSNSIGKTDTIPFFDPRKEMFLEYDLARLVYNLSNTKKTVVGLLTSAPIGGGFDPATQQPSQPWVGRRAGAQAVRRADAAGERAEDRRRRERAVDRAPHDARRHDASTRSTSSSCAAAAR